MITPTAEIGILGGSGFYSFLGEADEVVVDTPYGPPSGRPRVGEIEGRRVAFLPRHGPDHSLPPHMINYRANVWALRQLGVARVLSPCASGSLRREVAPGHFVTCDQIVDRTAGRKDTFYDGPSATHVAFADPFCPELRPIVVNVGAELGITVHPSGTIVVIQGPRFSTRAESAFYAGQGWDVINMTQYPEAILARELEMCCVNISLITDYDVGLEGVPAVTAEGVVRIFRQNDEKLQELLVTMIPRIPPERSCLCASALQGARLE